MKFSSYKVQNLLKSSESPLGKIVSKASSLSSLHDCFKAILDPDLIAQCRLGQYENGIITLFTHSAAMGTRLRFHVPQLLSALRQHEDFRGLKSIQVKIATYMPPIKNPEDAVHEPLVPLPASQADMMLQLAESLKDDDPASQQLAKSLKNLAKRGR